MNVIYCCYHFFFSPQNFDDNILFDKFPCHLQGANTKISVKQKAINTQHTFMCRMDHSDIIYEL